MPVPHGARRHVVAGLGGEALRQFGFENVIFGDEFGRNFEAGFGGKVVDFAFALNNKPYRTPKITSIVN